ncbi:MAG: type I-MYXAN CRISPR-associated protein Cas6/Cmx6 [Pseudomonadota bacterium]|nr:type I-MYXAN CRISPR-associated protein Cas6/Cmx6 [Pseudomonadota bacterium]
MFWQEDDSEKTLQVPDDVVDILFSIDCKRLPVDHAYALSAALREALPWVGEDPSVVAVHAVHVAGSQNGWERPEHGSDQRLIVSRRTKLTIRVSKERMDELMDDLRGKTLDVSGCPLTVREGKIRPLSRESTLFSRYVVTRPDDSEDDFLAWAASELRASDIRVRKALCGKDAPLVTPDGPIRTRSLMLADLTQKESVRLQQTGLGPHREMGCGIFIPHKGIEAVKKVG